MNMESDRRYRYWVLCKLQGDSYAKNILASFGGIFKHQPPTLTELIEFQDEVLQDDHYSNYKSCIILNFK